MINMVTATRMPVHWSTTSPDICEHDPDGTKVEAIRITPGTHHQAEPFVALEPLEPFTPQRGIDAHGFLDRFQIVFDAIEFDFHKNKDLLLVCFNYLNRLSIAPAFVQEPLKILAPR